MIHTILLILHVLTASAWFGLSIRLGSQARLAAGGQPIVAVDGARTLSLMGSMLIATFVFSMMLLILGGGYPGQIQYHIASALILVLLGIQFVFLRPAWSRLRSALENTGNQEYMELNQENPSSYARTVSITSGIGHLLWVVLLVLMFWNRLTS